MQQSCSGYTHSITEKLKTSTIHMFFTIMHTFDCDCILVGDFKQTDLRTVLEAVEPSQGCLGAQTDKMFRDAATQNNSVSLVECSSSVTSDVDKHSELEYN